MEEDLGVVEDEDQQPNALKLTEGYLPSYEFKNTLLDYVEHYKKYKSLRTLIFR